VVKRVLTIGLALAVAAGGYYVWSSRTAQGAARAAALSYVTANVQRGVLEITVSGTANIMPVDRRTAKSTVSGTVAKILAEDGQPVKSGQIVMVITNDDLALQHAQARIDLDSQKLNLDSLRSPSPGERSAGQVRVQQAENALENRQKDLGKLTITAPIEGRVTAVKVNPGDAVGAGQLLVTVADDTQIFVMAQVNQSDISGVRVGQPASVAFGTELPTADGVVDSIGAEATTSGKSTTVPVAIRINNKSGTYRIGLQANAMIKVGSDETVSASGAAAPKTKYDVKADVTGNVESLSVREGDSVKAGQTLVQISNESLRVAIEQAESDLQVARESLDRISSGLSPNISDKDIKQQELRVRQAELTLESRASDVSALQVKSPIAGILVSHAVSVGDMVNSSAPMFVVADLSTSQMVIPVDELDITQVKIGQKANVMADALPGRTFIAEVTKVASEGTVKDGVANYDVTLTLKGAQDLKSSMTAAATIVIDKRENVLLVPSEAIRTTGGRRSVVLLRDGASVQTDIKVGLANDMYTEIVSGLNEGDKVAISSQVGQQQVGMPFGGGQTRIMQGPATSIPAVPRGR
jgi:HlyD family secretion protein